MKYIILSVLLLGLTSCSVSNPPSETSNENTTSGAFVEWIQDSNSGVSVSSGSDSTSLDSSGNILISNDSGNVSMGESGETSVSSGDNIMTVWKDGVSVGTGIKVGTKETDDMSKDPEVQNIQKDIDAIFSDIEKGGK